MLIQINDQQRKSYRLVRDGKDDFLFIPGAEYHHKKGGKYRIIVITNTGATDSDYPVSVTYENIETGEPWSKGFERFADGMTLVRSAGPKHRYELIADDVFDHVEPAMEEQQSSLYVDWGVDKVGFGQILISIAQDGSVELMDEGMGKDFAKALLCHLVDKATIEPPQTKD